MSLSGLNPNVSVKFSVADQLFVMKTGLSGVQVRLKQFSAECR